MTRPKLLLPAVLLCGTLLCLACSEKPDANNRTETKPVLHTGSAIPDNLKPHQQRAEASFSAMQKKIGGRLMEVIAKEGASAAVDVCKIEASDLTASVAEQDGYSLGRTSHRLRNPANSPPAWATERVEWGTGKKSADAEVTVVDLGDRVGVLAPIGTMPMCLTCHGDPASLESEVKGRLDAQYPQDSATGFVAGDLRGWFWAEVPK